MAPGDTSQEGRRERPFLHFDFDAAVRAPFRMQPGLRRIAPGTPQLSPNVAPNRGGARHLREKLAVLSAFPEDTLQAVPGFDATPVVGALACHAAAEHPDALGWDGARLHARWLGWSLDAADAPCDEGSGWPEIGPLLQGLPAAWRKPALLALAFAEDFALIDGRTTTIDWLAVALPSFWAPAEKVGQPFAAVHQPVADNQLVVGAAAHLARLVVGDERWERFVWTVTSHPRLHAHPSRVDPVRWPAAWPAEELGRQAWLRTERQTFIPVAGRGQAIFTIRVDTWRLAGVAADPGRARALHDAIASMSDAVLAYRSLTDARARLLDWLAARAGG